MCGIAGFCGTYPKLSLLKMMDLMIHRGPDDSGYYYSETDGFNIGMGHRRLSIIDLEHGKQPIWNETNDTAVICNGEIYNFRQLRESLKSKGHIFKTNSDTEVILHGYEEFGYDVVNHLEGMFGFAIWDQKNQTWQLGRDRFGIKPLYYIHSDKYGFAFASEIKPLLYLINKRAVNLEGLYHYLLYGFNSNEQTIFKEIKQLKPAHTLIYKDQKIQKRRYWEFHKKTHHQTKTEWAKLLHSKFYSSVSSHMVSDVPVGITLSGGLDSSSVLSMMTKAWKGPDRIKSFTIRYGLPDDETPYARKMIQHCKTNPYERQHSVQDIINNYEKIIWHLEEPLAHTALGTTYFFGKLVSEHCKVILIGEGADELFGGYPHFKLFSYPYKLAPAFLHNHYYKGAAFIMPSVKSLTKLLKPEMLNKELLKEVSHAYDHYFIEHRRNQGSIHADIENPLIYNQLSRIDKLTMAHSVEARVPFLDKNFAELAYNVPFKYKVRRGVHKKILRDTMKNDLPQKVLYRPKSGKGGTQALMPLLTKTFIDFHQDKCLSQSSIQKRGWFDPNEVQNYFDQAKSFKIKHHPIEIRRRQKFALGLITLETWSKIFLDNAPFGDS